MNNLLVDGLATGATPCGAPPLAGMKVVGRDTLPAGIVATSTSLIFKSFRDDWVDPQGWNIGARTIDFQSRCGTIRNLYGSGSRKNGPMVLVRPGFGFDGMEFCTFLNAAVPMVLKQEKNGVAAKIARCIIRGQSQDVFKISGRNWITENLIGRGIKRTTGPHSDVATMMAAEGGVSIDHNYVEHGYEGADDSGTNNLLRFEAYWSGAIFDNVDVFGNLFKHENPRSAGIHVTGKNSPVWRGSIGIYDNRLDKAGGWSKILYAASPRITRWANNIDPKTGQLIPISAT